MCPLLDVNLSDVSPDGPPKFDPGVYELECTKAEIGRNEQDASKVWIDCIFMLANREAGDQRQVRNRFFISDKAMFILKRFLLSAGSPMAEEASIDTDLMVGLICKAKVEHKPAIKDGVEVIYTNLTQFILPEAA